MQSGIKTILQTMECRPHEWWGISRDMASHPGRKIPRLYAFRRARVSSLLIPLSLTAFLGSLLGFPSAAEAEWRVAAESLLFYTDDAALFSAIRQLTRDQDPTQPVIDRELAEQGDDVVYEPDAQVSKSFSLPG